MYKSKRFIHPNVLASGRLGTEKKKKLNNKTLEGFLEPVYLDAVHDGRLSLGP